jgi:type III secretion protein S
MDGGLDTDQIVYLGQQAMYIMLTLSLPAILAATIFGLLVAVFQTALQLQEQTLSFLVKMVAMIATLLITGSWFGSQLTMFLDQMFEQFPIITR